MNETAPTEAKTEISGKTRTATRRTTNYTGERIEMGRKSTSVPPMEVTATGSTGATVALAGIARAIRERSSAPRKTAGRKDAASDSSVPAGDNTSISNLAAAVDPNREKVAQLAYRYWEARGCEGGSPEQDWFRAEQEIRERTAAKRTS